MKRVEMLRDLVADEGYRPTIDDDGDIMFKVEGERFFFDTDTDDEKYVRLMLIFGLDESTNRERALALANYMNRRMKAAKFTIAPSSSVMVSIEAFYDEPQHFAPFLSRAISALKTGSDDFFEKLRSDEPFEDDV